MVEKSLFFEIRLELTLWRVVKKATEIDNRKSSGTEHLKPLHGQDKKSAELGPKFKN